MVGVPVIAKANVVALQAFHQGARFALLTGRAEQLLRLVGGVVLSFGWNSNGMGAPAGFKVVEVLLCRHGGGHNDTICLAEVRRQMHRPRASWRSRTKND